MILSIHFLFGAAVGSALNNPVLGLPVAFASHYMLDSLPHREYDIENVVNIYSVGWRKSIIDLLKVAVDFLVGLIVLILLLPNNPTLPWLILFGFLACVPDGFSFLYFLTANNNILTKHWRFHKKIHIRENPKDTPWNLGLIFQILTAVAAILFLYSINF